VSAIRNSVQQAVKQKMAAVNTPGRAIGRMMVQTVRSGTAIGVTSGTIAGLVIAPRLINMQGQTSGLGAGIAAGLSATTIAEILAVALAIAIAIAASLGLARRTAQISDPAALRSPARPLRTPGAHPAKITF